LLTDKLGAESYTDDFSCLIFFFYFQIAIHYGRASKISSFNILTDFRALTFYKIFVIYFLTAFKGFRSNKTK